MKTPHNIMRLALVLMALQVIISCEEEKEPESESLLKPKLEGHIQKGPFVNGTSIRVAELNPNLSQTGRSFVTNTNDNTGSFALTDIQLSSPFVELQADGFYFNEVSNEVTEARLFLYALSDLSNKSMMNVNMISHLEKDRIYHLISEGLEFEEAKAQAQQEVLSIFSIDQAGISSSELLDISKQGDEHAILLAISVILQGHRSVGELSELLANIISDFSSDGVVDNGDLGTMLINHATILNLPEIRSQLEARYATLNQEVILPDFERYVNHFIENTSYQASQLIDYPEFSNYGENVLYGSKSEFNENDWYSLAADLSVGTSIMIRLSGGLWYFRVAPDGPVNWKPSSYSHETNSQTFTSIESDLFCDLAIQFKLRESSDSVQVIRGDSILVEYFENETEVPSRSKILHINE